RRAEGPRDAAAGTGQGRTADRPGGRRRDRRSRGRSLRGRGRVGLRVLLGLAAAGVERAARRQDVDDPVVLVAAVAVAGLTPVGVPDLHDELADLAGQERRARVVVAVAGVVELLDGAGPADAAPAVVGVALGREVGVHGARLQAEVHVLVTEEQAREAAVAAAG